MLKILWLYLIMVVAAYFAGRSWRLGNDTNRLVYFIYCGVLVTISLMALALNIQLQSA